jgi:hypothetical protein
MSNPQPPKDPEKRAELNQKTSTQFLLTASTVILLLVGVIVFGYSRLVGGL